MGLSYILRRLLVMIPVFFLVVTAVFFMIRFAPGGPFSSEKKVPPQVLKNLEAKYHMDEPLVQQYFRYLGDLSRFDLGPSFKHSNRTVNEIIAEALPVSMELGLIALCWALLIGITAGGLAALKPNTLYDYIPMSLSIMGICLPTFVIGPLLVLVFGLWLGWLPVAGWNSWQDRLLPSLTLGFAYAAYISRLTRGGFMEIRHQDFIRTARAKGLTETQILTKHALRGGILPVVSYLGPALAGIITGALVTETIFNIPGLGRFFIESALNRDYTMVMGTSLLYFSLIFLCNFLVDIIYVVLDPRVRYE
ncbi:MAG: ABC transporter permease subunit [Deltaproteobacteria bacterium]|nr:ABC transporter permease subunit [Deltaproteobacteria bacterium]MBM4316629.1 ABC transporter permease subunit [Deltaproteobacteria bacterium]